MTSDQFSTSSTALRVLRILEFVGSVNAPVTVAKVADATELDHATAYRALMTLHSGGYLNRDTENKTFFLSWKIVSIAKHQLNKAGSLTHIRNAMQRIVDETGETCHYTCQDGHDTVLLMRVPGKELVTVNYSIGDRSKLYYTSIGKAILAYQSQEFVETVCGEGSWAPLTEHTVTNLSQLLQRLEQIRDTQISYDNDEIVVGMKCVAVPIINDDGSVHSGLSVSGPATRFSPERMQYLGETLKEVASIITDNKQ